nr:calcium/calmodulin-dependent 3',5'-cyclic nucleotide phosphodiesterase 1C [Microcebus murinus]
MEISGYDDGANVFFSRLPAGCRQVGRWMIFLNESNFCETMDKSKIHAIFKYEFHCGTNATWAARNIDELFGKDVANELIVSGWLEKFHSGDFNLESEPCGQPETKVDNDELKAVVEANPSQPTCELAARLRSLVKQLERGEASVVDLKKNLEYAATVLESVYIDETRRLLDTEDELSDIQSDAVPSEVRDWLASTFTRQMGMMLRRSEEKPRFKSIVHAVQAGIFVERMYRRTSNMVGLSYPPAVIEALKDVDKWSFDVFSLNEASGDHALKFIFYELLTRYDLISRFKIPISALVSFVEALEVGYSKHKNPYHNLMHAADVTQTVHYLLYKTGVANWLTELEIFAIIFSAAIHDYEHTGTTNNFHIQTRSDPAILYNDRSVLENHHLSAAYRLLQEDEEMNILVNLSKDDWR